MTLTAAVLPEGTVHSGVYFVNERAANVKILAGSSDVGSATTKQNGMDLAVTGVSTGWIAITVGSQDFTSMTRSYVFKIVPDTTPKMTLDKQELSLKVGATDKLNVTLKNCEGTPSFISSEETVLKVEQDGTLVPLAAGSATVTVTLEEKNLTASCKVTGLPPDPVIELVQTELTLTEGESGSVGATLLYAEGTLLYEASEEGIVEINADGTLNALKAGIVTVTVKTEDGSLSATLQVTVNAADPLPDEGGDEDPLPDEGGDEDPLPDEGGEEEPLPEGEQTEVNE